jgi:hypothetical protein
MRDDDEVNANVREIKVEFEQLSRCTAGALEDMLRWARSDVGCLTEPHEGTSLLHSPGNCRGARRLEAYFLMLMEGVNISSVNPGMASTRLGHASALNHV